MITKTPEVPVLDSIVRDINEPSKLWVLKSSYPGRLCCFGWGSRGYEEILAFTSEDAAIRELTETTWKDLTAGVIPEEMSLCDILAYARNMPPNPVYNQKCLGIWIRDEDQRIPI